LSVTYEIVTGEKADFGAVTVTGAEKVDPGFIASFRSWQEGAQFSPDEIVATRRSLTKSKLFHSVGVNPGTLVDEQGQIPIEIQVKERDHRTIGGGIDYSTADEIGVNGFGSIATCSGREKNCGFTWRHLNCSKVFEPVSTNRNF